MKHETYISTAYLNLIFSARPDLKKEITRTLSVIEPDPLEDYLSGKAFTAVFKVLQTHGVESLLLEFAAQLQLASHGPLTTAALAAPDLKTAIQTFIEFTPIRSNLYDTSWSVKAGKMRVLVKPKSADPVTNIWLSEIALDLVRAMIELTMGHAIGSQAVFKFSYSEPSYAKALRTLLGANLYFDSDSTVIEFPASWGNARSPLANESTFEDACAQCRSLLMQLNHEGNTTTIVKLLLEKHFATQREAWVSSRNQHIATKAPPNLNNLASTLAVSPRTLARRLEANRSSYKTLLAEIRDSYAKQLLARSHLNMTDIAQILGYSEAANFNRAFRRTNGVPPNLWRKIR